MNNFRLLAILFVGIAFIGIMILSTTYKSIGILVMAAGLIPSTIFLYKAKEEESIK